jgi:hypothetical protein
MRTKNKKIKTVMSALYSSSYFELKRTIKITASNKNKKDSEKLFFLLYFTESINSITFGCCIEEFHKRLLCLGETQGQ